MPPKKLSGPGAAL
jgi:hypothetical protein